MKSVIILTLAIVLLIPLSVHAQNETIGISDEISIIVATGNISEISSKIDKLESKIRELDQTITLLREDLKNDGFDIQEFFDTGKSIVDFGGSVIDLIQNAVSLKSELLSGITDIEADISFALTIEDDEQTRESLLKVQDKIIELKQEIQSDSLLESPDEIQSMIKDIHAKVNSEEFGLEETKNEVRNIENNMDFLVGAISEIKKQNDEMLEITKSLKTEVQLLDEHLLLHEKWSGGLASIAITIGAIVGIAGWVIGIAGLIPNRTARKEESKKRKKIMEQLKKNLVEILDLTKTLKESSPNMEKLPDLRTWKLIKLRTNVISTIITGSMTLLDMKLIHRTLEYLNYMDDQFDIGDKKYSVSYIWLVKHTKLFLDKFFPEHVEERRIFLENMKEQAEWAEKEHDKEMAEYDEWAEKEYEKEMEEQAEWDKIAYDKEMAERLEWYEENYDPELYQDDVKETDDSKESDEK